MLKKFLRTSVLTLGAGLCVFATLQNKSHAIQNESHAMLFDNIFSHPSTVTTGIYVKYRDQNDQEQVQWGPTHETSVAARTKTFLDLLDVNSLTETLTEDVLDKGGTHIQYGFSVTVLAIIPSGELQSETLNREAYDFSDFMAIMQKPLRTFPHPLEGVAIRTFSHP